MVAQWCQPQLDGRRVWERECIIGELPFGYIKKDIVLTHCRRLRFSTDLEPTGPGMLFMAVYMGRSQGKEGTGQSWKSAMIMNAQVFA